MSQQVSSIFSTFFKNVLLTSYLFNPNTPFKIFAFGNKISDPQESIAVGDFDFQTVQFNQASNGEAVSSSAVTINIIPDSNITGIAILADQQDLQSDLSVWNLDTPIPFPDGGSLVVNSVTFKLDDPA